MSPRELDVLEAVSEGALQPGRRAGALPLGPDGQVPPEQDLSEARRREPHRSHRNRAPARARPRARERDLAPSALHRPRGGAAGRLSFRPLAHPLLLLDVLVGLGLLAVIGVAAKRPPASTSSATKLVGWALLSCRFRWQSLCTRRFPSRSNKRRSSAVSSRLPSARCWFSVRTTAAISHRRATTSSRRRGGPSSSGTRAYARERPRAPLLR